MYLVDIQNLSRRFSQVQALAGVSLRLAPGTVGLVGNNGAGKSTLLKILLGILRPDSGSGTVLGCDILTSGAQLRGRVGYMPESAATVPVLKGVEFVSLAGDLYGMPHADARRRAHEVLGYVGLGELRYRRLEEYSTGNLQRLKLAAALVHDPQLLLLDEPTGGLDPRGRLGMLRLIEDLIRETRKSVILCTHLLGDVERICDQVVFLDRGRVLRCDTVAALRERTRGRYLVGWQGPGERFLASLSQAGAEVSDIGNNRAVVAVPESWTTTDLLSRARDHDTVLTLLKPDEEDLERAFLRLTENPAAETHVDLAEVSVNKLPEAD